MYSSSGLTLHDLWFRKSLFFRGGGHLTGEREKGKGEGREREKETQGVGGGGGGGEMKTETDTENHIHSRQLHRYIHACMYMYIKRPA